MFLMLMCHRWFDSGKDDGKIERQLEQVPAASSQPSLTPPLDGMNRNMLHFLSLSVCYYSFLATDKQCAQARTHAYIILTAIFQVNWVSRS